MLNPDLHLPKLLNNLISLFALFGMLGRLFLENSKLEYVENENSILGQGGSGTVIYRAQYQGKPVAVKRFQIKKYKISANSAAGNEPRVKQCRSVGCFFFSSFHV